MDFRFTCYLSYLIKFYLLGLICSAVFNSYTFYTFGRDECDNSIRLYHQSIAAIATGLFAAQLLAILLVIPDERHTDTRQDRDNWRRPVVAFLIAYIVTTILAAWDLYLFISAGMYDWQQHLPTSCRRIYYNTTYACTILAAIPSVLITVWFLLYIIVCMMDSLVSVCDNICSAATNSATRRTTRQTQTPKFINPQAMIGPNPGRAPGTDTTSLGSTGSDDSLILDGETFTFDAPELQLKPLIPNPATKYPSRKYNYPTTTTISSPEQQQMPLTYRPNF